MISEWLRLKISRTNLHGTVRVLALWARIRNVNYFTHLFLFTYIKFHGHFGSLPVKDCEISIFGPKLEITIHLRKPFNRMIKVVDIVPNCDWNEHLIPMARDSTYSFVFMRTTLKKNSR